jgi:hypothetical protein
MLDVPAGEPSPIGFTRTCRRRVMCGDLILGFSDYTSR